MFKAVVSRKKGEGGSESENSSDSSGEDDTSTWTSGLASSIRNRARGKGCGFEIRGMA